MNILEIVPDDWYNFNVDFTLINLRKRLKETYTHSVRMF